ncbi:octapeptide-repeat protein T2-like [Ranitomeya imitator]|uniref:octapeptide-repeat protein T2-like n=1 Tax=Ranitomeya imitator TaxID=111125 RepID=UPI0037E94A02
MQSRTTGDRVKSGRRNKEQKCGRQSQEQKAEPRTEMQETEPRARGRAKNRTQLRAEKEKTELRADNRKVERRAEMLEAEPGVETLEAESRVETLEVEPRAEPQEAMPRARTAGGKAKSQKAERHMLLWRAKQRSTESWVVANREEKCKATSSGEQSREVQSHWQWQTSREIRQSPLFIHFCKVDQDGGSLPPAGTRHPELAATGRSSSPVSRSSKDSTCAV